MNVRILAINQGLSVTNTIQRINLLEKEGSFSAEMAEGLRESYMLLTHYRIKLQIRNIKGLQKDAHHLDLELLGHEERERLRHAIIRVEDLQNMIHTNFNIV